jgi:type II secretory pathway component PulC
MPVRKRRSQVVGGRALAMLLVGIPIALMVAYWSWLFLVRPIAIPSAPFDGAPDRLAKQLQARHLFGVAGGVIGAVSAIPDAAQLILAGIVSSGSAKGGLAVILIEGKKAVTARVGQEIMPDLVLSRVAHDHVELTRRGQTINLRLATKK